MTKLFVSYARKDSAIIHPLAQELQDLGFEIWIDTSKLRGGSTWSSEIVKGIIDCDFFLLFISSNSIKSDSVRREVDLAYKNRKNIIPLRLEKVVIPLEWDYQTIGIQWIECTEENWKSRLYIALGEKSTVSESQPLLLGKKVLSKQEKRVQIIIEGDVADFNDTRKQDLIAMLAAVLRVDENEIRLLSVKAGSIVLELALSRSVLNRLFDLARNHDPELAKLNFRTIVFNLSNVFYGILDLNVNDSSIFIDETQNTLEIRSTQDFSQPENARLTDAELKLLIENFKEILGNRVLEIRVNDKLSQSVARLVDDTRSAERNRAFESDQSKQETPGEILEINPTHTILKNLMNLDAKSDLFIVIVEQIFDSALLVEGLHPDSSRLTSHVQNIIEAALVLRLNKGN